LSKTSLDDWALIMMEHIMMDNRKVNFFMSNFF
jgi:hypothetical protein